MNRFSGFKSRWMIPFHATPEYKSGLIAEQRLGGQAQEMLLRNQLNSQIPSEDSSETAVQDDVRQPTFTRDSAPRTTPKPPSDVLRDTVKQIPDELNKQLGGIAEAWSDPGAVLNGAAEEAKRKWDDIKAGK